MASNARSCQWAPRAVEVRIAAFRHIPDCHTVLLRETAATGYKSRVLCFPREPADSSGGLPFTMKRGGQCQTGSFDD